VGFYQNEGSGILSNEGSGILSNEGSGILSNEGSGDFISSHLYNTSFSPVCRDEYIPNISSKKSSFIDIKVHSFFIVYQIT
jgi:hypothetical protein